MHSEKVLIHVTFFKISLMSVVICKQKHLHQNEIVHYV